MTITPKGFNGFRPLRVCIRSYAAQQSNTAVVARLRKETQAPLAKVKEALEKHGYDYQKALDHVLSQQATVSAKLAGRIAKDGAVGVWVSPCFSKSTMVEVNCETDFVAKSPEFAEIVSHVRKVLAEDDTSKSGHVFSELTTERFAEDETVKMGIGRLREKIDVRRAIKGQATTPDNVIVFGGYAHGYQEGMGRIGALVALSIENCKKPVERERQQALGKLAKQIAQQVVGFGPKAIESTDGSVPESDTLLGQDFLFGGGKVKEVLNSAGEKANVFIKVSEFVRFECGEGIHKEEGNFAEEVRRQVGGGN
ncbi:hypothetical protein HDU97_007915 [Phlyctochytrium planicorne]|nr:hypothetical protein HDU97_007915 [Phlyctochytrium planicorne]